MNTESRTPCYKRDEEGSQSALLIFSSSAGVDENNPFLDNFARSLS
jgi:hypothetical protein